MKLFRIFRRQRRAYYWVGRDDYLGMSVGPFTTKLDALLAGPYPIPDFVADLVKQ